MSFDEAFVPEASAFNYGHGYGLRAAGDLMPFDAFKVDITPGIVIIMVPKKKMPSCGFVPQPGEPILAEVRALVDDKLLDGPSPIKKRDSATRGRQLRNTTRPHEW